MYAMGGLGHHHAKINYQYTNFFTIRKGIDPKQASFALFNYPSKFLKQSQTHYVQAVTYTINNLI
jgi:hypothetical protein